MTTAPRFRRQKPLEQYGTLDIRHMTPEEIVAADDAGHLEDLLDGRDPDGTVDHKPYCNEPQVEEGTGHSSSIRVGDPVTFTCRTCHATKQI